MDDTSLQVKAMHRELLMKRSNPERFVMGALMFDAARELIIASLPANLSELEKKQALFERIYGYPLKFLFGPEF